MAGRKFEIAGKLKEGEQFGESHVFDLVTSMFKWELATVVGLFCIDALFRITISVLILYLFTAVADGAVTIAYIYAGVIVLISYICQLAKQSGFVRSHMLATRIKGSLSMLLYAKTSSLTSYVIKSSQLGKITNLLASDLGVIENRLSNFLGSFNFPIYAIGGTTLLVIRLGWPGILGVLLVILTLPLSNCVSKYNGTLIQKINVYKDKRIQTTSEVIEGIKFVKLYGW
jgi:ABC-type multidrug transport system fused ATPase/permease subunit